MLTNGPVSPSESFLTGAPRKMSREMSISHFTLLYYDTNLLYKITGDQVSVRKEWVNILFQWGGIHQQNFQISTLPC